MAKRSKRNRQPEITFSEKFPTVRLLAGRDLRAAARISNYLRYEHNGVSARLTDSHVAKLSRRTQVHPNIVRWQGYVEGLKTKPYPWATEEISNNFIRFGEQDLEKAIERVSKEVNP